MNLEPYTPDHSDLYREALAALVARGHPKPELDGETWVARDDGEACGLFVLAPDFARSEGLCRVAYLRPGHSRTAGLRACVSWAKRRGLRRLKGHSARRGWGRVVERWGGQVNPEIPDEYFLEI